MAITQPMQFPKTIPDAEPDPRRCDSTTRVAQGLSPCDDVDDILNDEEEILLDEILGSLREIEN